MNLPLSLTGKRVLIAGAGGGFDVYAGVPLALELVRHGNEVFFSNYSFTHLQNIVGGEWLTSHCLKVTPSSTLTAGDYFPEKYLAQWLADRGGFLPAVYAYAGVGVRNLRQALEAVVRRHEIDAVFVVDGGCDGIFRGDEYDLGTPSMDSISIVAASLLGLPEAYYVLTAFGTEGANHEVSHAQALERIGDLNRDGHFVGSCSLVKADPVAAPFQECVRSCYARMRFRKESNIVNSILASVRGEFGDVAVTERVRESPVWVSALTSMYWFFDLDAVARMKLFYQDILETEDVTSVAHQIEKWRPKAKGQRPGIPI